MGNNGLPYWVATACLAYLQIGENMNWHEEKVIVFGGGGFLGRYLIEALQKLGCTDIRSFGRSAQPENKALGVDVVRGDLASATDVSQACKDCTMVFHTAAKAGVWGSESDYFRTNVTGTENVIAGCVANEIEYLIFTSSPSVSYHPSQHIENRDESHPYPEKYLAPYPKTKALAEQMVMKANGTIIGNCCDTPKALKTVSLRPHLLWGPRDPHLLSRLIERARDKKLVIVGDGSAKVDLTFIENVAESHICAAESLKKSDTAAGKVYFITDDEPVVLWDWINGLLGKCGLEPVSRKIPYRAAYAIGAVMELIYTIFPVKGEPKLTRFLSGQLAHSHYFDISAAKRDLNYQPRVSQSEAMTKTLNWLKEKYDLQTSPDAQKKQVRKGMTKTGLIQE